MPFLDSTRKIDPDKVVFGASERPLDQNVYPSKKMCTLRRSWRKSLFFHFQNTSSGSYESKYHKLSNAFDLSKKFASWVIWRRCELRCVDLRSRYFRYFRHCRSSCSKCTRSQIEDYLTVGFPIVNDHIRFWSKISRSQIDTSVSRWTQYHAESKFWCLIKNIRTAIVFTFNINRVPVILAWLEPFHEQNGIFWTVLPRK